MKTINDIIAIMDYMERFTSCNTMACEHCKKLNYCWLDTLSITYKYIEREGVI